MKKRTLSLLLALALCLGLCLGLCAPALADNLPQDGGGTAWPSTQKVLLNGELVEFQMYALKNAEGNLTNYIKLRDLGILLADTAARFGVGQDPTGAVVLTSGGTYVPNGMENVAVFSDPRPYTKLSGKTLVDGRDTGLAAFRLFDDAYNGYTYYQLKDLANALGFSVKWADGMIRLDTTSVKPTMRYTGYYTGDESLIAEYKALLRDSTVLLSDSAEGKQKIADMYRRVDEIVNAPTQIVKADTYVQGVSYCGTAYYVDADGGDDGNDGLTPETAFRTPARACDMAGLKEGDAVFFKRGCIFYDCCSHVTSGVTYSAYGEGPKPILTTSPAAANDPDNWELYYEKDGKRIWHYKLNNIGSVGWIDFNCSDDLYAFPVYEYWSPENGFQHIENIYLDYGDFEKGEVWEGFSQNRYGALVTMSIEDQLVEDLTFISRSNYADAGNSAYEYANWVPDTELYLRCDAGDPAEVFDVVKLTTMTDSRARCPLWAWFETGVTLDNLEFSNGAQNGVTNLTDSTIQNCEVSFIGNTVAAYDRWVPDEIGEIAVMYIGDGIYNCVSGCTVKNNFVHHCCCVGISGERYEGRVDPWVVDSNVVMYTGNGIGFQEGPEWTELDMGDFYYRDNYVAYMGQFDGVLRWYNDFNALYIYGWDDSGTTDVYKYLASHQHFTGNTFIGGYDSSLNSVVDGIQAIATFTGNTFVGNRMDNLLMLLDRAHVIKYWQLCD